MLRICLAGGFGRLSLCDSHKLGIVEFILIEPMWWHLCSKIILKTKYDLSSFTYHTHFHTLRNALGRINKASPVRGSLHHGQACFVCRLFLRGIHPRFICRLFLVDGAEF